jgi:hypothetical protein
MVDRSAHAIFRPQQLPALARAAALGTAAAGATLHGGRNRVTTSQPTTSRVALVHAIQEQPVVGIQNDQCQRNSQGRLHITGEPSRTAHDLPGNAEA